MATGGVTSSRLGLSHGRSPDQIAVAVILLLIMFVSLHCVFRVDSATVADTADDEPDVSNRIEETVTVHRHSAAKRHNATVTRQTVDERQQDEWALLARNNVMSMKSDSIRCATPRPRVIGVQDVHPQASKRFVPSCIVLHRCGKDSGCCDDADSVCSAIQKERVFEYFYVVSLGEQNGVTSVEVNGRVDRLRFVNHTQCGCRRRRRLSFTSDVISTPDEKAVISGATALGGTGRCPQVVHVLVFAMTFVIVTIMC